jgi:hypothetical protein
VFVWKPKASKAFEALNCAFSSGPMLQMSNFNPQFVIGCAILGKDFSAMLQ